MDGGRGTMAPAASFDRRSKDFGADRLALRKKAEAQLKERLY